MKLADSGLNPFEFTEKYDEQIRVTIVLMVDPNATPSQIEVLEEDIYNHVENSIYLKHLKVSLTVLLYAGGDFGERNFNIPPKPNRRTELDLTTSAPLA